MPPPSPARQTRKSLSALPTALSSAAGSASSANLALPPSAAGTSSSGASKPKPATKRAASFAPGDVAPARVAVFGQRDEGGGKVAAAAAALSPRKVARRALVPRKSILKTYNPDDVTLNFTTGQIGLGRQRSPAVADSDDDEDDDEDETQFRRLPGESTTRMLDRRVSFAAHAHVRMFEIDAGRNPALSQSTSSVGSTSTTASNPPSPAPPKPAPPPPTAAANMFAGAPPASAQAAATRRRSSTGTTAAAAEEKTPAGSSRRRSSAASFASEGSADMSMDEDFDDDGDEMEMTQAVGGIQAAPLPAAAEDNAPFSPSASTLSAHSDDDDDLAGGPRDDEDRTMDFTVATGGIIPPSAPATADANVRRSLGYGVEEDEARRLNTWFASQQAPPPPARTSREQAAARAAAEEMEGYDDADDDGMELTTAQGGIVFGSAAPVTVVAGRGPDESTDEVEMDLDDDGGMDYTTAAGGIFGSAPGAHADDDETEEVDADAMDFTVAGGGISDPAPAAEEETANLDFTTAGGGIFGSGRASLSAPASRQSLSGRSPAKSPRKSAAPGGPAPTPTRPIPSSLSRPTASSAAKAKAFTPSASGSGGGAGARNLFESPAKQRATAAAAAAAASPAASRKRAATDDGEAAAAIFGKSPAKRRASAATAVTGPRAGAGDVFGQPPASTLGEPEEVDPTPPAPAAPTTHSIFSPVKNAFSSIFSPKASPAPAAPAAVAGAKATFPTSLFGSPLARAPNPPSQAPAGPAPPEINIFSTSPQAAPPPALSASFSSAAGGLFNPSPEEVLAEADAAFDAEVEQQQDRETTPPPAQELEQAPPPRMREETATPSKKRLGRPSLAVAGAGGGAGATADRTAQDAAAADDEDADEMFQPEPVSLNQFLDMTGLSFMTNITAGRRRSTIQPGELLGLHRKATEGTGRSGGDYSLVDYAHHVLNMQDYVVYHWACNNLREATEKSRHVVQVLDEEASLANPLLFTEYLEADDDEKRMIETQLKHLKTYAQHTVKKRWLEWRLDILTPLRAGHENDKADLLEDRARLAEAGAAFKAETDLVELRARHAALRLQLAQEKKKVEDVQACDQQELAHRRSDIQEQKDQIDGVKSEVHDVGVILASLQAKKESILGQKKTYLDAIEFGKHASAGSFTAERLSELEDEVRTLEYLHSVQLTERSATHVELVILADLKLVLACEDFVPTPVGATVELVGTTKTRRNPELAQRLFGLVQRVVDEDKFDDVPALVQKVHQLWLATVRLTHELHLIRLRYPVSYSSPAPATVRTSAPVMICPIKAKFVVSFDLTADILARWPASTAAISVGVDVQYSRADVKADPEVLKSVIVGRLQNADQRAGALVDGCLDAVGRYC